MFRARLDLGDYHFDEGKYDAESERIKAEVLLPKVAGPSFSEIVARQSRHLTQSLPRHQGVGSPKESEEVQLNVNQETSSDSPSNNRITSSNYENQYYAIETQEQSSDGGLNQSPIPTESPCNVLGRNLLLSDIQQLSGEQDTQGLLSLEESTAGHAETLETVDLTDSMSLEPEDKEDNDNGEQMFALSGVEILSPFSRMSGPSPLFNASEFNTNMSRWRCGTDSDKGSSPAVGILGFSQVDFRGFRQWLALGFV
jgi:hypothetical protein